MGTAIPCMEIMTESFAELFEQSLANQRIRPGMILTGLVVDVTDDIVIVNVGLKSEAVIPVEQFKNERGVIEVKAGDMVVVALDSVEDGTGETRLSREKAKRARTWTRLEEAFNAGEIVIGIITGRVKAAMLDSNDVTGTAFKVITNRGTVYLMGRVTQREADRATDIARNTSGVQRVVRVLEIIPEEELARLRLQPAAAPAPAPPAAAPASGAAPAPAR